MPTVQTQIRIDSELKHRVSILFNDLGLDLSTAVNIFLRQCDFRHGLPFEVKIPEYSDEMKLAFQEAEAIVNDDTVPSYDNMEDLKRALMS